MTERNARRAGNITRRGAGSWRLKLALPKATDGRRRVRYLTVRGSRQDAQKALAAALLEVDPVSTSKRTTSQYLEQWIYGQAAAVGRKTYERHDELVRLQIVPYIGHVPLQSLRPANIAAWHSELLARGGRQGRPLSRATVGLAHRVLHRALEDAMRLELINRNPCATIKPPRPAPREARSLQVEQVKALLEALQVSSHRTSVLRPVVTLALATGMRRGEILGLRWSDLDFEKCTLTIERSIEQTRKHGLTFKQPKTKSGRRVVALAPAAIELLRAWRAIAATNGQGWPKPDAPVFPAVNGGPLNPDSLSTTFARFMRLYGLPAVSFHGLRHTHASALIRGGVDITNVATRLGHASPQVTLRTYAHQFKTADHTVSAVIEGLLKSSR